MPATIDPTALRARLANVDRGEAQTLAWNLRQAVEFSHEDLRTDVAAFLIEALPAAQLAEFKRLVTHHRDGSLGG